MSRDRSVVLRRAVAGILNNKRSVLRNGAGAVMETLEDRRLLSATPSWPVLPVPPDATDNDYFPWGSGTYNYNGLTWTDAEKDAQPGDDLLCWAGTAANMLEFTGWGFVDTLPAMTNSDDMFEHFVDNWQDEGGWMEEGINWWFTGDASGILVDQTGGGGFYPALTPSDYMNFYLGIYQKAGTDFEPGFGQEIMAKMESAVFAGQGIGLSMHGSLAHAVTGWGMRLNPNASFDPGPDDKPDVLWTKWNEYLNSYYEGVWISDSDNGPQVTERRNSPNTLNYYDIDWDGSLWTIDSYIGGAYISTLTTLDRRDGYNVPTNLILLNDTVKENRPVGTVVGNLLAADADTINKAYTYEFIDGAGAGDNSLFSIANGQIRTNAVFDYERKSSYAVLVRATDQTGLITEMPLTIHVENVNEQPLAINIAASPFTRSSPIATPVGVLSTIDPDSKASGFGGDFTYQMVAGSGDTDNSLFKITGPQVTLLKDISATTQQTFSIRVKTTDAAGMSYEQVLTIQPSPSSLKIDKGTVNENLSANTLVGNLTANSGLAPFDGELTWSLVDSLLPGEAADNWQFKIVGNQLLTAIPMNHEAQDKCHVHVRAMNQYGWSFQGSLTILVNDLNDAPSALVLTGNAVQPTMAVNTVVGRLFTQDEDQGQTFAYALVAGTGSADNALFTIVGDELRLNQKLTLPLRQAYTVRVRSVDSGAPAAFIEKYFTLNLTGNSAPISVIFTSRTVREDAAIGSLVGTFAGADPDPGDVLTYSLVAGPGSANNNLFEVRGDELHTATNLDFETNAICYIRFRVTDSYGEWVENIAQITVTDVAEAPVDLTLSSSIVPENQPAGIVVGDLVAVGNPTPAVPVSLQLYGNTYPDNAAFDIVNGQLVTKTPFDFEAKAAYTIQISATAGGEVFVKVFTINVVNGNDAPTNIVLGKSTVAENLPAGAVVGTLIGVDADIADVLTYSLTQDDAYPDNAFFAIGAAGKLVTAAEFDLEKKNLYTIQVRATDASGILYFDKVFQIRISNSNDAPLLFGLNTDEIVRDLRAGDVVCEVGARDEDMGDYFTTSLVAGEGDDDNSLFNLNYLELRTKAALPYEHGRSYSVRVGVTDRYGATTSKMYTITCNDPYYVAPAPTLAITTEGRASITVNLLPNLMRAMSVSQPLLSITQPAHGTAIMGSNGVVIYQPRLGYVGADLFTYTLDGAVGQVEVKVNIPSVPNVAITGTTGNDRIALSMVNGILRATVNDVLQQYLTTDSTTLKIYGLAGNDNILLASSVTRSFFIDGGAGDDVIGAGSGNDSIYGGGGNDTVRGNAGTDLIFGQTGMDTLVGGAGNDSIYGGTDYDFISGEIGDDSLIGGLGNDIVYGGAGNDRLSGDDGDDRLMGGIGNDTLVGGAGIDNMFGDDGNDVFFAIDALADRIDGGLGTDLVHRDTRDVLRGIERSVLS